MKENDLDRFTPSQGRIIFLLLQKDHVPMHELVDKAQLSKSTLSSHLDNLERLGIVKKIPSNEDKREIFIVLTDELHNLKENYLKVSREMTELFYKGFSLEDIEKFEAYLRKCLQNLQMHLY
ncbi:MAG: MarR family transcriptional regulator [Promethearchaeota archaeon]|nr:MAG: MarR family transcriptional regulator [Candidatus Lokiarchaeota archaeon]